ncbi:MAG: SDR family oxidoreductase [Gemmatimonadales bacterium]|nr:SDR family oxidoreductase [Gemmatimonadales bacterium]
MPRPAGDAVTVEIPARRRARLTRLTQRITLVTGSVRGIGAAIARAFAREGAIVWVTDLRDDEGAALAASLGGAARYARLDVRREDDWRRVTDALLAAHGRLDVLVNNAGITGFEEGTGAHDPEHLALDAWRAVLATNLEGVVLGCRAAIGAMRRHGAGSIVNIASRSGMVGIPRAAAYAASKAAVLNHTRTVALYCAEEGLRVRCNAIAPAAILTPMWDAMLGEGPDRGAREAAMVADTPLRRFGTPEEVAALAVYLAADESGYATGGVFTLDGGLLAGSAAAPPAPR